MRHRPAACAAPPVTLRVGGDERTDLVRVVHVEAFDGDVVGVAISGLHFMQVEARGEEQHRLATGCHQGFIDIGGHTRRTGHDAEGGGFKQGEIAVASAHFEHGLGGQRVAI